VDRGFLQVRRKTSRASVVPNRRCSNFHDRKATCVLCFICSCDQTRFFFLRFLPNGSNGAAAPGTKGRGSIRVWKGRFGGEIGLVRLLVVLSRSGSMIQTQRIA